MICPACNNFRPATQELCPYCNTPSPLIGGPGVGSSAQFSPAMGSTLPFAVGTNGHNYMASQTVSGGEAYDNALWAHVVDPQAFPTASPPSEQPQSLLPVPYQPQQTGMAPQSLVTMTPGFPGIQVGGDGSVLIPAPPPTEPAVHIQPMYTKPRPIIPRYRAISGLLSVLIVFGLLCAGTTYYAKATGKLAFLHVIYGDARQKDIKPPPVTHLRVPAMTLLQGPAFNVIPSAATASKFDTQHNIALDHTNQFKVGQDIFVTYSVHPRSPGSVTIKWYTNDTFYLASDPVPVTDTKKEYTGYVNIQFSKPLEGKVEIYWNNQVAVTLFFVV
ncbi:MAG TPA: hypothetical protein VJ761_18345, partial [Ktedonobacteraceae bacterium]|nr:hypothetical protein [Ktedonobacteraceae bacterium]